MTFMQVVKQIFKHWTWTELLAFFASLFVAVFLVLKGLGV